jgi:hypothetical protein
MQQILLSKMIDFREAGSLPETSVGVLKGRLARKRAKWEKAGESNSVNLGTMNPYLTYIWCLLLLRYLRIINCVVSSRWQR